MFLRFLRRLGAVQPLTSILPEERGPKLRRVLGWPGLVAIGLGTMIGGIFTTIGAGAATAGPGVIAGFLLSGLACVFVALCYAEFAAMVPVAGSAYTYAYATLGEFVAWVIGWDLILEYGISAAPVAASWSAYVQDLVSAIGLRLPAWAQQAHLAITDGHIDLAKTHVDVPAVAVVLIISALLAIGIKESTSVNNALVVLQIGSILVFIVVCFFFVNPAHFRPFSPLGIHGIVKSAALVFFAYIGFDTVTVASEESRNPQRDVPIGILVSLLVGGLLYIAIAYVTVGVVPWQHIDQNAAMSQAIRMAGHRPIFLLIVAFGAIAGTTTVMITSLLGQTRIFYVMARDRMLPPAVARIHPVFHTPARMTMITGLIVAVLAAIVPLEKLLEMVNIGTLSAFSIVCLGVFVLRFTAPDAQRP
ncbi:MAG: amino acid permease, partial [Candidatus Eremiobacteraeota bacterium]|nr:amino acid permease [Candidatus Eremiobacteraeota bacterium]